MVAGEVGSGDTVSVKNIAPAGFVDWLNEGSESSESVSVHPFSDAAGRVAHVRTVYVCGVETDGGWRAVRVGGA